MSAKEWVIVAPDLTLMGEAAPQRRDPLRAIFHCDALDWAQRRALAGRPSADPALAQAGGFAAMVPDLPGLLLHRLLTLADPSP